MFELPDDDDNFWEVRDFLMIKMTIKLNLWKGNCVLCAKKIKARLWTWHSQGRIY